MRPTPSGSIAELGVGGKPAELAGRESGSPPRLETGVARPLSGSAAVADGTPDGRVTNILFVPSTKRPPRGGSVRGAGARVGGAGVGGKLGLLVVADAGAPRGSAANGCGCVCEATMGDFDDPAPGDCGGSGPCVIPVRPDNAVVRGGRCGVVCCAYCC